MRTRLLVGLVAIMMTAVLASTSLRAQAPASARSSAAAEGWTPPRTVDGHPDLSGVWTNATYTPFERPAEFKDREFFTEEEAAAYAKRRLDALHNQPADNIHYDDAIWMSEKTPRGMTSLRTSIIVEPRDGRLPPMTQQGQRRADARQAARRQIGQFDSAQARSLSERCIIWQHEGPPILPTGYNSNLQIVQAPGHVVIMHEMMRDPRIIPLDGRPQPGRGIQKYRGVSRGHFDGNTLVIETTNFTDKTNFRGASPAQRVIERLTPVDADTIRYEFTVEDPQTWATPWSGEYPMTRLSGQLDRLYEYACHEGNYGIATILRGARAAEQEARAAQ